jgi:hypothetical protein
VDISPERISLQRRKELLKALKPEPLGAEGKIQRGTGKRSLAGKSQIAPPAFAPGSYMKRVPLPKLDLHFKLREAFVPQGNPGSIDLCISLKLPIRSLHLNGSLFHGSSQVNFPGKHAPKLLQRNVLRRKKEGEDSGKGCPGLFVILIRSVPPKGNASGAKLGNLHFQTVFSPGKIADAFSQRNAEERSRMGKKSSGKPQILRSGTGALQKGRERKSKPRASGNFQKFEKLLQAWSMEFSPERGLRKKNPLSPKLSGSEIDFRAEHLYPIHPASGGGREFQAENRVPFKRKGAVQELPSQGENISLLVQFQNASFQGAEKLRREISQGFQQRGKAFGKNMEIPKLHPVELEGFSEKGSQPHLDESLPHLYQGNSLFEKPQIFHGVSPERIAPELLKGERSIKMDPGLFHQNLADKGGTHVGGEKRPHTQEKASHDDDHGQHNFFSHTR